MLIFFKKNKRIKIYHIKGIGCPLLILINIDVSFLTKERKNKKEEKMIRLEPRLPADNLNAYLLTLRYSVFQIQEMCFRSRVVNLGTTTKLCYVILLPSHIRDTSW